jgi:hypothetical protein
MALKHLIYKDFEFCLSFPALRLPVPSEHCQIQDSRLVAHNWVGFWLEEFGHLRFFFLILSIQRHVSSAELSLKLFYLFINPLLI